MLKCGRLTHVVVIFVFNLFSTEFTSNIVNETAIYLLKHQVLEDIIKLTYFKSNLLKK